MRYGWLALVLACTALMFALRSGIAAAAPDPTAPASELARIERLIEVVGQSTDRTFIRNGTAYDAATAARFLRLKWDHSQAPIRTAEDFIREIGSQSGTSGSRYRVRASDGSEEDSAAYLMRLLTKGAPPTLR